MKQIILLLCLAALSYSSQAEVNYFNKAVDCLSVDDIKAVQNHFTQFQQFTRGQSDKVCRDQLPEKWFEVIRSTLALQRLNVTDLLQRDLDDDFTRRPIGNKDWWTYYKERANQYVVEPSRCTNPNIVAYVFPFFRGSINLCPRFFEMDAGSQIETLMHEVRHFDGHPHVTCTQGNENGTRGACDSKIENGGSYAVSVQAGVELSYVNQLSDADRILSEAGAIYSINNKFNAKPKVKATNFIFAANQAGEVYRLPEFNTESAELVTTLPTASAVYGNGQQFTIFPLDVNENAYRISKDFTINAEAIGAFANQYNAENGLERAKYGPVAYYGDGAISKENSLFTFCGENAQGMTEFKFQNGDIKALPVLKDSEGEDKMFIMTASGDVYNFECNDKTGRLTSSLVSKNLPRNTNMAFTFDNKSAVVLTDGGMLKSYNMSTEAFEGELSSETDWVSVTPLKIYNVFDSVQ